MDGVPGGLMLVEPTDVVLLRRLAWSSLSNGLGGVNQKDRQTQNRDDDFVQEIIV